MKSSFKNALVVAAIFLAGVVTGTVNSIGLGQRMAEQRLSVDRFHATLMEILMSELQLSREQAARIEPVVRQACEQYRELMFETARRVSALVRATNSRIERELSPQQIHRLRELEAQREQLARQKLSSEGLQKDFLGQ
ncbi:MAG: hypothetical protein N3G20_01990 [Verrucomicrobiae bacterium]|nr:hypothetical protein [Verrucomicrobiae bacterium]